MRVIADCPLTFYDEVDFRDVAFFIKNVTVLAGGLKTTWHETKSDLVNEVGIEFCTDVKEVAEARRDNDIFEQEVRHYELLDPVWDSIEVLTLLKEHLASILVPIPMKVLLNLLLELSRDVETAAMRLVLDTTDEIEPLLELLLVKTLVLALD